MQSRLQAYFSILFFLSATTVFCQQTLSVSDGSTNAMLPGATVKIRDQVFVANDSGNVAIPGALKNVQAEVRFLGYSPVNILLTGADQRVRLYPDYELLQTVTVYAYSRQRALSEVAGSFTSIDRKQIEGQGPSSVVSAINQLPGIRMEKRSPGSYRLNIRGSTLRSPFGVRNVKIYYNQIPITEPTGNSPLNLLDLEHLDRISFIRAPASSLYGAGTGGVMFLDEGIERQQGVRTVLDIEGGSFGYYNLHAGIESEGARGYILGDVGITGTDGYREHTEMQRKNASVMGGISLGDDHSVSYTLLYSDLFYELPGGLTEEQKEEDPRQARQIAIDQNSTLNQKYLIAGISHDIYWNPEGGNTTSLFYNSSNKENPFITNYEFEDLTGGGIRTTFHQAVDAFTGKLTITAGGEWQWGRFEANNFGNSGGFPDTIRYVDDTRMFTGFELIQAEWDAGRWHITAGASLNHLNYNFNRKVDVALDSAYEVDRNFQTQFSPRVGIVRKLGRSALFLNASYGFSPPTQDEVRTSNGSLNTTLEAEKAWSLEAGLRSDLVANKLFADLTLYRIVQDNSIVSRVDEAGNSLFINSGQTLHQGLELLMEWNVIQSETNTVRDLRISGSLAWNDLTFEEYVREVNGENTDFSGNELTGGVPLTYHLGLEMAFKGAYSLTVSELFTSEIPLNDANTVFGESYHLIRARFMKSFDLGKNRLSVFAGVDNLLDESYSLGNDLNAFGNRYFNPSPKRNYFAGMKLLFL